MNFLAALLLWCCVGARAAPAADWVETLPDYGTPPVPMYSGFLNATRADPGAAVHLHYWFAGASAPNPDKLPLVLWLNGGPGSSSVLGMLEEWGPLIVNATGGLSENPYAWTQLANMLILESPSGVGYSYCAQSATTGCNNTDVSTARAARVAMQEFFLNFPEFKSNEFFITGESYAGVYVPTLAKEILDHAPEINLKGIAVGDPCTDNAAQKDSMDMLWYGNKNGFVDPAVYDLLWNKCGARHPGSAMKISSLSPETMMTMESTTTECLVAQRKYLTSTSRGFSQSWKNDFINNLDLFSPSAVVDFSAPNSLNFEVATWMMRDDVRAALHVDSSPNKKWPGPDEKWLYTKQWNACNQSPQFQESMVDFYKAIAPKLRTTIVFNGDTDPCVSYEGTRAALATVFPELPGGSYRPWFYNAAETTEAFLASVSIETFDRSERCHQRTNRVSPESSEALVLSAFVTHVFVPSFLFPFCF